jgi:hypothetical protein
MSSLVLVVEGIGRYSEAETLFRKVSEICEQDFSEDLEDTSRPRRRLDLVVQQLELDEGFGDGDGEEHEKYDESEGNESQRDEEKQRWHGTSDDCEIGSVTACLLPRMIRCGRPLTTNLLSKVARSIYK